MYLKGKEILLEPRSKSGHCLTVSVSSAYVFDLMLGPSYSSKVMIHGTTCNACWCNEHKLGALS